MNEYNGFEFAVNPKDYLQAPTLSISSLPNIPTAESQNLPPILATALESTSDSDILSKSELESLVNQKSNISRKADDLQVQINAEITVRDTALSLTKLHSDNSGRSTPKANRFSKMLRSESNGHSRSHSRQAEMDAEASNQKIGQMKEVILELKAKCREIELKIVKHHSAVMSHALKAQGAYTDPEKLDRNLFGDNTSNNDARIKELVERLQLAYPPERFPKATDDLSYLNEVYTDIHDDKSELQAQCDAYEAQIELNMEKMKYLHQEIMSIKRSNNPDFKTSKDLTETAAMENLRRELISEYGVVNKLNSNLESQRLQLERTTKALEDVMKLAVQYEMEKSTYEEVINDLEHKIQDLEENRGKILVNNLAEQQNPGILCLEFRKIVQNLIREQYVELRQLRSKLVEQNKVEEGNNSEAVKSKNPGIFDQPPKTNTSPADAVPAIPDKHTANGDVYGNYTSRESRSTNPQPTEPQSTEPQPTALRNQATPSTLGNDPTSTNNSKTNISASTEDQLANMRMRKPPATKEEISPFKSRANYEVNTHSPLSEEVYTSSRAHQERVKPQGSPLKTQVANAYQQEYPDEDDENSDYDDQKSRITVNSNDRSFEPTIYENSEIPPPNPNHWIYNGHESTSSSIYLDQNYSSSQANLGGQSSRNQSVNELL